MSATKKGGSANMFGGNVKNMLRRMFAERAKPLSNVSADNPDEYAEIVKENFGISYESGSYRYHELCP
jgi:hypothetical protein